jgi:hypothetical protein
MGIAALFSTLVRGVGWTKILEMAIEHGPGLYRKAKERFQPEGTQAAEAEESQLHERINRLEKSLLEQESLLAKQLTQNEVLEQRCAQLEKRLRMFRIITALLSLAALILLAFLMRQS